MLLITHSLMQIPEFCFYLGISHSHSGSSRPGEHKDLFLGTAAAVDLLRAMLKQHDLPLERHYPDGADPQKLRCCPRAPRHA